MKAISRLAGVVGATAFLAAIANGQTCVGRPYFSTGPVQVGAGADVGNGMQAYGFDVGLGADRSAFGRLNVARAMESRDPAGPDRSGTALGGTVGWQANLAAKHSVQVCPYASYQQQNLEWNATDPSNRNYRNTEFDAGASVGFILAHQRSFHWVPFAGMAFAHTGSSVTPEGSRRFTENDDYLPATFGLGLHYKSSVMFTGQVMVPFGAENNDPRFGLRVVLPTSRR